MRVSISENGSPSIIVYRMCVFVCERGRQGGMEESVVHHPLPPTGNLISELAVMPPARSSWLGCFGKRETQAASLCTIGHGRKMKGMCHYLSVIQCFATKCSHCFMLSWLLVWHDIILTDSWFSYLFLLSVASWCCSINGEKQDDAHTTHKALRRVIPASKSSGRLALYCIY